MRDILKRVYNVTVLCGKIMGIGTMIIKKLIILIMLSFLLTSPAFAQGIYSMYLWEEKFVSSWLGRDYWECTYEETSLFGSNRYHTYKFYDLNEDGCPPGIE